MINSNRITYESAGVSIPRGDESVRRIKAIAHSTFSSQVLKDIGLFGGFFELDTAHYRKPVLVSSIDGVGTKLKIAFEMDIHDTVGEDIVNHCVNDVMTSGADPLFFLDYLALGKLRPEIVEKLVEGMARGCRNAGCALIGGETAEMPGLYRENEYDVAGVMVGIVEKSACIDGTRIKKDDILIALPSNGLHTNGYSLARKVFFEVGHYKVRDYIDELGCTLGEELLRVHLSYLTAVKSVREMQGLKAIVHVTGGGIIGNTIRVLPEGRSVAIEWGNIKVAPVFTFIQTLGRIDDDEMRRVYNLGVGLVLIIDPHIHADLAGRLEKLNYRPYFIGRVT